MARRYACAFTVSTARATDVEVAVIGAGVVGCAVTLALARRGVDVVLLEAEAEPGLGASGTNSGILHTGFDSTPGELETEMLLASNALRDELLTTLRIPVLRCGAVMRAYDAGQRRALAEVAATAGRNGVSVRQADEVTVEIPGEVVTDPVAYTLALGAEAERQGAQLRTGWRVDAIEQEAAGLNVRAADGEAIAARVAVNCAGLEADRIARIVGDESFAIYPRKGEFMVFDPPGGEPLAHILLPIPTGRTKGVLVFPTIDGKVIAGPTAIDLADKSDWTVRAEASEEIMAKAVAMFPPLEGAQPIAAYAGLRPAGRNVNYLIGPSSASPSVVNVAAIRSTGLSASLGIAQRVTQLVGSLGVRLGAERELRGGPPPSFHHPWWERTARYRAVAA
jgi:glycerol-3-phosphate dehydrogenase